MGKRNETVSTRPVHEFREANGVLLDGAGVDDDSTGMEPATTMAWLLIETPDGQRRQYKLGELDSGFGRAKANAVPLADQKCSSFHCLIKPQRGGRYVVVDAGSRNGTQVNGVGLGQGEERLLEEGDLITLGQTSIRYSASAPATELEVARILNPQETAAAIAAGEIVSLPVLGGDSANETSAATTADTHAALPLISGTSPALKQALRGSAAAASAAHPQDPTAKETESLVAGVFASAAASANTFESSGTAGIVASPDAGAHASSRSMSLLAALVAMISVAAFAAGSVYGSSTPSAATNASASDGSEGAGHAVSPQPISNADGAVLDLTQPRFDDSLSTEIAELREHQAAMHQLMQDLDARQAQWFTEKTGLVKDLAEHVGALQQSIAEGQTSSPVLQEDLEHVYRLLANLHEHLDLDFEIESDIDLETATTTPSD